MVQTNDPTTSFPECAVTCVPWGGGCTSNCGRTGRTASAKSVCCGNRRFCHVWIDCGGCNSYGQTLGVRDLRDVQQADIVGEAIESILGQPYKNYEVLVVDNELTDGTHETVRWFGNRIRVMRQENAEPGTARNRGIVVASGEIIAFQD